MPAYLYVGRPGGGKSHAMMKEQILPFLSDERNGEALVHTNIEGLQRPECLAAIDAYCGRPVSHRIRFIDSLDIVRDPGCWYHPDLNPNPAPFDFRGSLIVLDEFPQLLSVDEKPPKHFLDLCLNHRRYLLNDYPTIMVFAAQSSDLLHRQLRASIIDETRQYLKRSFLGSSRADSYRYTYLFGFATPSQIDRTQKQKNYVATGIAKYDPAVFPCYNTSLSNNHKEKQSELSIFKPSLIFGLIASLGFVIGGIYYAHKQFSSDSSFMGVNTKKEASASASAAPAVGSTAAIAGASYKSFDAKSGLSANAQYVGEFNANGERVFIFMQDGRRKYAFYKDFKAITDYGSFIKFELHTGDIISDVYTTKSDAIAAGKQDDKHKNSELK